MNRAERRRCKKQGLPVKHDPVYMVKESDMIRQRNEVESFAVDTAMVLLFAIPIKVMNEQFGWGAKTRLPKFIDALAEEYEVFSKGEMTLEAYSNYVFEKVGLQFQKNGGI